MEYQLESTARGTRIITGDEAKVRRRILKALYYVAEINDYQEIVLPTVEQASLYSDKAGPEVLGQMYCFEDRGGRTLSLRPEGTATVQALAREKFKGYKDVRVFYESRCFRYERPQAGRYREFTQFGCEILWPRDPEAAASQVWALATTMMAAMGITQYEEESNVKRGLAYYVGGGFEFRIPSLGAQKQVLGGGSYAEGVGFAFGVDRLVLASK